MTAAIVAGVIELVKVAPDLADAFHAWTASNADATPEAIAAKLGEYKAASDARRQAVADFDASLKQ